MSSGFVVEVDDGPTSSSCCCCFLEFNSSRKSVSSSPNKSKLIDSVATAASEFTSATLCCGCWRKSRSSPFSLSAPAKRSSSFWSASVFDGLDTSCSTLSLAMFSKKSPSFDSVKNWSNLDSVCDSSVFGAPASGSSTRLICSVDKGPSSDGWVASTGESSAVDCTSSTTASSSKTSSSVEIPGASLVDSWSLSRISDSVVRLSRTGSSSFLSIEIVAFSDSKSWFCSKSGCKGTSTFSSVSISALFRPSWLWLLKKSSSLLLVPNKSSITFSCCCGCCGICSCSSGISCGNSTSVDLCTVSSSSLVSIIGWSGWSGCCMLEKKSSCWLDVLWSSPPNKSLLSLATGSSLVTGSDSSWLSTILSLLNSDIVIGNGYSGNQMSKEINYNELN